MKKIDIEKLNRENFNSLMNSLSRPGLTQDIKPFQGSFMLAIGSVLLYSEVSYFYSGDEEFDLLEAMSNCKKEDIAKADYVFSDKLDLDLLKIAKIGTPYSPEFSASIIYKCKNFSGLKVTLSGPGIDGEKIEELPINEEFIQVYNKKNAPYPQGNEIYFLNESGEIKALSRTTTIRS